MSRGTENKQEYQLLNALYKILLALADRITALGRKVEAIQGRNPEYAVLVIYTIAHLCMAIFHEPFFDEAEAWQIAKCVSLKTLLFETTHYEGHPPLWHLLLMPLAKAGAPYEVSLTLVSLVFMGAAVFLILWYAPFPRIVRLLLPFTYFYFYQYGVISRVYCLMTLEFVLLAMVYRVRNDKPGRYVAVLMLLCVTSAYGVVIAGGLALVWLWEIWDRKGIRGLAGRYGRDRRIWWLGALLAVAVCAILQIMPRRDTYAVAQIEYETVYNSFLVRLIYMLLVLPADVTLTDVFGEHTYLYKASLPASALLSGAIVGGLLWFLLLFYGKKKGTVLLCVLPYMLFAFFGAAVYISLHHIGIGLLYLCFWVWASMESWGGTACGENGIVQSVEQPVRGAAILLGTLALGISLFWTVVSCILDIDKTYAAGRNEAAFIKEHHLDQYRIMAGWMVTLDDAGNTVDVDINLCDLAVNVAPYFDHNIFFNFNEGRNDRNYVTHMHLAREETETMYDTWRTEGQPQVLWMNPDLKLVYGEFVDGQKYVLVYRAPIERVWKAGTDYNTCDIYVTQELLEETGLSMIRIDRQEKDGK